MGEKWELKIFLFSSFTSSFCSTFLFFSSLISLLSYFLNPIFFDPVIEDCVGVRVELVIT